jgi:hypothetical protein
MWGRAPDWDGLVVYTLAYLGALHSATDGSKEPAAAWPT